MAKVYNKSLVGQQVCPEASRNLWRCYEISDETASYPYYLVTFTGGDEVEHDKKAFELLQEAYDYMDEESGNYRIEF